MSIVVSILIVSYNSENYLKACIDSILNSETKYQSEIIVVDNNSSDKSVEVLSSYGEQIKLLVNNYNYGFARAMNQAVRLATADYILTFNPDAELSKNAIEQAVDYFKRNKEVGLMAPVIMSSNGSAHYPNYNLPVFDSSSSWRFFAEKLFIKKISPEPKEVDFVYGTGIILDRQLLNNGALYPEDTFLFWEEYYLGKQAQKLNKKVVINPSFTISHHRSVSFKFNKEKIEWMQKLILPYGFQVRISEHGRFLATLNYIYKSLDNLILWLILEAGRICGIEKTSLRYNSAINFRIYLKSVFMSRIQSIDFHKDAMVYFNGGKKCPPPTF